MTNTTIRPGWDTGDWSGLPPTTIHDYDPTWPGRYEAVAAEIATALAGLDVQIEHMGSTAVPGLGARAGIDIMVGLADPADADAAVEPLVALGYKHHFSRADWTHLSGRGCKLHLCPRASQRWADQLLFRDHLRANPEAAAAYDRLKRDLAREHGADGTQYVEGKTAFVQKTLTEARQASRE